VISASRGVSRGDELTKIDCQFTEEDFRIGGA
jgi:hypothetical protein